MSSTSFTPDRTGHVAAEGGAGIHYQYFGSGGRPTVVLFNGANQTAAAWHRHLSHLIGKVDVLVWDYRGQGGSTGPQSEEDSFARFADDLRAVVDTLGLPPGSLDLLAVCYGGGPAAEFLLRHRPMVRRALFSGAVLTREEAYVNQRIFDQKLNRAGLAALNAECFFAYALNGMFQRLVGAAPDHKAALLRRIEETMNQTADRAIDVQLRFLAGADARAAAYAAVDLPIHVIAGEEDQMTPTFMQRRIPALFPRCTYAEQPRLGHLLYVENPHGFFADALAFFSAAGGPA
jgi:3-oxoadipate enol-lactonase